MYPVCQHEGCENLADHECLYPYPADPHHLIWLCEQHMPEEGFCSGCYLFVLGADDAHLHSHGLCGECMDDLRYELGERDDDDYDAWG